jgi:hypothetical protein
MYVCTVFLKNTHKSKISDPFSYYLALFVAAARVFRRAKSLARTKSRR